MAEANFRGPLGGSPGNGVYSARWRVEGGKRRLDQPNALNEPQNREGAKLFCEIELRDLVVLEVWQQPDLTMQGQVAPKSIMSLHGHERIASRIWT